MSVKRLFLTKSVCPECLGRIDAEIIEDDGWVYMEKSCDAHGSFRTLIWQDSGDNYLRWLNYGGYAPGPIQPDDCPRACGLCEAHLQKTCSAALMVTTECDMQCPICFTRGGKKFVPTLDEIADQMTAYKEAAGCCPPIELCGGEPTTREDLPKIVKAASEMGFTYIQLNTNGNRIAEEPDFLKKLMDNGLTTVYLGFDGITSKPYLVKYGQNMLYQKIRALRSCSLAGAAVVLVPCVIPGANDDQLGKIIQIAKEWMPTVKGVYFQPVSYFGAYPGIPDDGMRITIPEVLRKLEDQTAGEVKAVDFLPANCEHPACSFGGYFLKAKDGQLKAITRFGPRSLKADAAERVRKNTELMWCGGAANGLSIGGMAFQDAWNFDIERVRRCTIHIVGRDGHLTPLCVKYLTNLRGQKLYPNIS